MTNDPVQAKTADADVVGETTHLKVSQSALETEENPLLQQERSRLPENDSEQAASVNIPKAPAISTPPQFSEAVPGEDENAAGFIKKMPVG